jgi:hypothetical protein
VFEEGEDGRGGQPTAREGGCTRERGLGGGAARIRGELVGRIEIHGPTRSHASS